MAERQNIEMFKWKNEEEEWAKDDKNKGKKKKGILASIILKASFSL